MMLILAEETKYTYWHFFTRLMYNLTQITLVQQWYSLLLKQ